jgi:hypothetical protein
LTNPTTYDTRPTQAAIILPAPRWSISQRRSTSSAHQIPAPRQIGGGLDTSHAWRLVVWHRSAVRGAPVGTLHPAGQSSGRGAEPLTACAVPSFGLSPDSQ